MERQVGASSGSGQITVLACDDHPLILEGIASVLAGTADLLLVGQASNGTEAIETYRSLQPDVTLMDVQMPGLSGIETMTAIRSEFPAAKVVMLTTYRGDAQAIRAIKAGAFSYLLKDMLHKELRETIRTVHGGQHYIPSVVATEMAKNIANGQLSDREVETSAWRSSCMSEETVKAHMKNIMGKLAANDRTHAVSIGLRRGIINMT